MCRRESGSENNSVAPEDYLSVAMVLAPLEIISHFEHLSLPLQKRGAQRQKTEATWIFTIS